MWALTENQVNFLGRISIHRNQVASIDGDAEYLEFFQDKVSDRFSNLHPSFSTAPQKDSTLPPLPTPSFTHDETPSVVEGSTEANGTSNDASDDALMSIAWLRKLLDAFLCCEAEFKATLLMDRDPTHIVKPPLDRLIPELLDRTVKALDICNAITHGVESIGFVHKVAEIAVTALDERPFTDGQVRRASKALESVLSSIVINEEESTKSTEWSWSFGRRFSNGSAIKERQASSFRSLSWSVSKNWSAAKQIQAISSNLSTPYGNESNALAMSIYIMNVVLAFIMWTMVAAIPCQGRAGLGTSIHVPKNLTWAHSICGLQEHIAEEWKKKEKKGDGSTGLMEEVIKLEKVSQSLMDCLVRFQFPMEEAVEVEMAAQVAELAEICQRMEDGLGPLQKQIREVFHRIVRSRVEVLDMLDQDAKASAPNL